MSFHGFNHPKGDTPCCLHTLPKAKTKTDDRQGELPVTTAEQTKDTVREKTDEQRTS